MNVRFIEKTKIYLRAEPRCIEMYSYGVKYTVANGCQDKANLRACQIHQNQYCLELYYGRACWIQALSDVLNGYLMTPVVLHSRKETSSKP